MFYTGNWVDSFPENYQWSNATSITKGMAPYGAVALAEIDEVVQRLHERANEPEAWHEEWTRVAARLERVADTAAAEGREATAGNYYLRAAMYYYTGERMVEPGEKKLEIYRKSLRCAHAGLTRRLKNIEIVDVPYEVSAPGNGALPHDISAPGGGALPAYFLRAQGVNGPAPTVVLFDGLDNCKEMSVLFAGQELSFRGFNTLAIDGPGQGEALRLRNIHSRYDYEVAGTAAFEYVASRSDVDPQRVAIAAYSLGGYYAPRIAAFERRYAACIAWGAIYDYHATWVRRRELAKTQSGTTQAASHFQIPWVLGVPDWDAAMKKLEKYALEGVAQRIHCPTLILHGEKDRLSSLETAQRLYDACGARDKTLKVFTAEDSGVEHCQADNRQVGTDYIGDWLQKRLG